MLIATTMPPDSRPIHSYVTVTAPPVTLALTDSHAPFDEHCQQREDFCCQLDSAVIQQGLWLGAHIICTQSQAWQCVWVHILCAPNRRLGSVYERRARNFKCFGLCVNCFSNGRSL